MSPFPPALPHGELVEVLPHIWQVTGESRPSFGGLDWCFSRNMTIFVEGGELVLVNTVRLDEGGLAKLDALGRVAHVLRIGAWHGRDDAFYVDRYGAELWAMEGLEDERGAVVSRRLVPGGETPVARGTVLRFEAGRAAEGLLLVDWAGGVLVACDSLQNWEAPDRWFDEVSRERMAAAGFFRRANVGPGFLGGSGVPVSDFAGDFERILSLPFDVLLSAHGKPLIGAKGALASTFASLLGGA